jgi:uncharacterized protein YbaA (DUF1428 family)
MKEMTEKYKDKSTPKMPYDMKKFSWGGFKIEVELEG